MRILRSLAVVVTAVLLPVSQVAAQNCWGYSSFANGRIGLGGVASVSLARAREKATEVRAKLADGQDPLIAKARMARMPTFGEV